MHSQMTMAMVLAVLLGWSHVVAASSERFDEDDVRAFTEMSKKIEGFSSAPRGNVEERRQSLEELVSLAREVEREWGRKNRELYGRLVVKLCGVLTSYDWGSNRRFGLAQSLAMEALNDKAGLSLRTECNLVPLVSRPWDAEGGPITDDGLVRVRKQQAVLGLQAMRRIAETIDESWDPESRPVVYVHVPMMVVETPEGGLTRVPDVATIEASERKRAEYQRQAEARWLRDHWLPGARLAILKSYMSGPGAPEGELDGLLRTYGVDEATRVQMLDAVKNKKIPASLLPPRPPLTRPAKPKEGAGAE
jgi:hypothetical protein